MIGFRCVYHPGSQTPTVSIDEPRSIDRTNASSFRVSGSCSEEGRPVKVSVGGVKTQVDCMNDTWVAFLDVTGLNKTSGSISITARHSSSDGRSAHRASKNVTNHFICPENFVGVPSLGDYTVDSFCVAKYEMKNDGSDQAVSQATGAPYTGVSKNDAVTKCAGMGSGYDLLTNDRWQSMVRHIELVADNWSGGNVGSSGGLSQGHSYSVSNGALAASSDDNKGCHGTEQTCDGRTWNKQRRTHTLSNGEVIWDVSGNAWEWVKDDNSDDSSDDSSDNDGADNSDADNSDADSGVYGDNAYMSQVTSTSHTTARSLSGGTTVTARVAKDQFGPNGDYSALNSGHYGGLGYGHLNENGGTVIRGGSWSSGEYGGIFQVSLADSNDGDLMASSIGFRCVYDPKSWPPTVSIDESESIDRTNVSSFRVSGSCSEEGRQVEVNVGGVKTQVDCMRMDAWVAILDVTGLNKAPGSISITAHHSSSDGRSAHMASESVTNNFICPENFVGVPALEGYTAHSFCVAKYEMKNDGSDNAVSQATGLPYMGFSRDGAITKCTDRGSGYDLLTNDEWQSMARHIELVSDNWSWSSFPNSVPSLNQGHSFAPNRFLPASPDDNKGCYGTQNICEGRSWAGQRRTHFLSNGEVIWDVSGNAMEWVKDSNIGSGEYYGNSEFIAQVTRTSHTTARSLSGGTTTTARVAKDQFGPSGDYLALNFAFYGGLGHATLRPTGGAVVRGGGWHGGSQAGIFAVSLIHLINDNGGLNNSIGFRCVYHPGQTPTVSIDESDNNINRTNASSFRVSGSCSEEGRQVEVSVGGVNTQVDCAGGVWVAVLDVTGLNKISGPISITAHHSSSDGLSGRMASKSVTNDFICPENFVGVPSLGDYTVSSFCVSKYEMKNGGSGQAVSQAAGCSLYGCQ